jgi:hypothetical protein
MKSGGQMSSQSPVVWWCREVNCEVVGMCVEAVLIAHNFMEPEGSLPYSQGPSFGPYSKLDQSS